MLKVDRIIEMIDWRQPEEIQREGILLARNVKQLQFFLDFSGDIGNNCAIIVAERSDEEIKPYLRDLLWWIDDIQRKGALILAERLIKYERNQFFYDTLEEMIQEEECYRLVPQLKKATNIEDFLGMWKKLDFRETIRYHELQQIPVTTGAIVDCDLALSFLDCNNPNEVQEEGVKIVNGIKNLRGFVYPNPADKYRNTWNNLSIILSNKTDKELRLYLWKMCNWMKNMKQPGAQNIYDRLLKYKEDDELRKVVELQIFWAQKDEEVGWMNFLEHFQKKILSDG